MSGIREALDALTAALQRHAAVMEDPDPDPVDAVAFNELF